MKYWGGLPDWRQSPIPILVANCNSRESNSWPRSHKSNTLTTGPPRHPTCNEYNEQAGWFLQPDCALSSECPHFGMPAELQSLHAGAARRLLLHAGAAVRFQRAYTIRSAGGLPEWQISKSISSASFVRIQLNFFLQYTGDKDAKNDGPEFSNSNSVIFEFFFEIFKKASRGPLCGRSGPLWSRPN